MSLMLFKNKHGKIGYIDQNGDIKIKPQYKGGFAFSNGFARVSKGNGYYFINEDNTPISEEYDFISDFALNGLALVGNNGNYYYINTQGQQVLTPPTTIKGNRLLPRSFIGEYAPLMGSGGVFNGRHVNKVYAFLSQLDELIIPPSNFYMHNFFGFSEGIARVTGAFLHSNSFYVANAYLNLKFELIEYGCKFGLDFKNGAAGASTGDKNDFFSGDNMGFIDKNGKFFIKPNYIKVNSFVEEGFAVVRRSYSNSNWIFIDKSEKTIFTLPKAITDVGEFNEGLCPIKRMGFWGFMDKKGEIIIPAESRQVESFKNGISKIVHKYGTSFINNKGGRVWGDRLPY